MSSSADRWREFLFAGLGGAVVLAVFLLRYAHFAPVDFVYRDDGVITMSHARNLVDFGSIGVDPSGSRVEGFSAPVQFWLYAAAYAATGVGYERFADVQTIAGSFLLGALLYLLTGLGAAAGRLQRLLATSVAACLLAFLYSFIGWHASGMENAVTHVLFLGAIVGLVFCLETGRARWSLLPLLTLASLSRLEAVWHLAPVLAIFSIAYWMRHRRLEGLALSAATAAGWSLYQLWRFVYFGSLVPNTAVVQRMAPSQRILDLFDPGGVTLSESTVLAVRLLTEHGAALALLALVALFFVRRDGTLFGAAALLASLVLTGALHPFAFGEARLDPTRTTTHMALASVALLALVASRLDGPPLRRGLAASALATAAASGLAVSYEPPRFLCCPIEDEAAIAEAFGATAERLGVPRPTVSTPDLGKLSWRKRFNIVDLGFLGSPVMAALEDDPALLTDYFLDYAGPDFVESHDSWSCLHSSLFTDPRFARRYVPMGALRVDKWTEENCHHYPSAPSGLWVRRELLRQDSPESRLIRDLAVKPSARRVRLELEVCAAAAEASACQYVTRSAYRFLPEFRAAGEYEALLDAFRNTRTAPYDLALLTSPRSGLWHRDAVAFLRNRSSRPALLAESR